MHCSMDQESLRHLTEFQDFSPPVVLINGMNDSEAKKACAVSMIPGMIGHLS
jgi:hypothetical protein